MLNASNRHSRFEGIHALHSSSLLHRRAFAYLAAAVTVSAASEALALPTNPQVESGVISITQPSATDLVINQGSDRAIINWQNFDILHGESTRFIQPNAGAIALNRVRDGNPTQILGKLSANGKLVLVNPNGVFFGVGSAVDVAGLVATTADISSQNFMGGIMKFDRAGNNDASIINEGHITATDGGLVALVAPGVRNSGVIQADLGTVALGGGTTFSLDMYGDGLYSFSVDGALTSAGRDNNGNAMQSAVENNGNISASGGKVLLTANAARDVVSNVINNQGVIEARAARVEGGTVVLDGGETGKVSVSGKIDVSGKRAMQKGGSVTVRGEHIDLAAADIDARGAAAGGTVRIGGSYIAQPTWKKAETVAGDKLTTIDVSAIENGDAGTTTLWSNESTAFAGTLLSKGGVNGGNGGLVEVSSNGQLHYAGRAQVQAAKGHAGTLLLDPTNIIIDAAMALATQSTLDAGGNVILSTAAAGDEAGDIVVNSTISWLGTGSLTLKALHDIIVNANITSSSAGSNTQGSVTLNADNNIFFNNAALSTVNGAIDIIGRKVGLLGSTIHSLTGDIVVNNSRGFSSNTANSICTSAASGAKVWLNQSPDGSIQNAIDAIGTTGSGGAKVTLGSGYWSEQVFINQGNFALVGQGDTTVVRAPSVLSNYITSRGLVAEPIIYVDNAPNVSVSRMQVIGDNTANIGIGFHRSNFASLTETLVRNVNGDAIFFDQSRNSTIQNNRVNGTLARPTLEMGSGIHVMGSHGTSIDNNTITNIGWDGIKIGGGIGYDVANNTISNTQRVGIYGAGISDSYIVGNNTNNINTQVTGFGGITVVGGSANLTLQGNVIRNVMHGVGILMNSVTGANLIAGNIINNTESHGIQTLSMPGVQIVDNFVGYLNTLGWSAGPDNIGGDGIHVAFSNGATIARNYINETKAKPTLQHGNGIYVRSSHNIVIGGSSAAEGNSIKNTGWDGIKIAGATGQTIRNNRITATERVGIYAAGVTNMLLADNVLNNLASRVTGYSGIAIDGGSANLTISGNQVNDVRNGSGIRLNSINGNNVLSGNKINGVKQDGIEVYNTQNLTATDNTIRNIDRDGIYLDGISNANLSANTIYDVNRDGIHAENLSADVGKNRVTQNNIYNIGHNGINLNNVTNAFVDANQVHDLKNDAIHATNLSAEPTERSVISNNDIYGIGYDGIHLESIEYASVTGNTIRRTSKNGIYADNSVGDILGERGSKLANLAPVGLDSSIFANNDVRLINQDGIHLEAMDNALLQNNFVQYVGAAGIAVNLSEGIAANNNTVEGGAFGMQFDRSYSASLVDNLLIASGIGVELHIGDDAFLSGNIFTGTTLGINLIDSLNANLENESFLMAAGGTGLRIAEGSSGTIVRDSSFENGDIAILITDAGSSMQFAGSNSSFAGNGKYFVLQNSAMLGQTLDASQQLFDGVRAADFTPAQLSNAEILRTTDLEDTVPVGNVFYKSFDNGGENATGEPDLLGIFDQSTLGENQGQRRGIYRRGNFSYAGRAYNLVTDSTEPTSFAIDRIDLSLLNSASSVPSVNIASQFASLTPAAGDENAATDPQSLNNLAPAAGGNIVQQPAGNILAPRDAGSSTSCVNDFLGGGYQSGFTCESSI
jgi:filamentous hemagglutinin family protein